MKRPRIEELDCPVEVRRHPGARRLTLRISRTRRAVIVTLPVQCDLGEAGSFLHRNLEWVRPHVDSAVSEDDLVMLADAQTSGGLLVAGELPGNPVIGHLVPRAGIETTIIVH